MSSGDAQIVQYVSAGMIGCGLLVTVGAGALFPLKTSIGKVTSTNPVPWSPRELGGTGPVGKSPVFGLMWSLIYTGELIYMLMLLATAARNDVSSRGVSTVFNHSACVYSGLLMSSLWPAVFSEQKRWCFVLASVQLVVTSIVVTVGAVVAKPFLNAVDSSSSSNWVLDFGGVVTSFFAGWCSVAAALSIGIVTRVYNRGVNTPPSSQPSQPETSLFPLVLSVALATISILFGNPVLLLPFLISTLFIKNAYGDWRVWGAMLVCLLGIAVSTATLLLYKQTGVFW